VTVKKIVRIIDKSNYTTVMTQNELLAWIPGVH